MQAEAGCQKDDVITYDDVVLPANRLATGCGPSNTALPQ